MTRDVQNVTVAVGQISVTLREEPARAMISCGPAVCYVGPAAGKHFFDELTKIREALLAADAVQRDDQAPSGPVTKSEVHLARLLVELDIGPSRKTPSEVKALEATSEIDRLLAEMAQLPDYRGWQFTYEYPGYFCYSRPDNSFSVFCTPDWEGDETLPIEVQVDDGRTCEEHSDRLPLPREGRTGQRIFDLVRSTLDKLLGETP